MKRIILIPFAVFFFVFERIGNALCWCFDAVCEFCEEAADMAWSWVEK